MSGVSAPFDGISGSFSKGLKDISLLERNNNSFIVGDGTVWASETSTEARSSLNVYSKSESDALSGGSSSLSGLTDTNITSPFDGALLFYDTGTSKWIDNVISGDITIADTGAATLMAEPVQDIVGGMVASNTETLITVTYQDSDGTLDFVVDNDLSNYDNSSSGFITTNPLTTFTQNDAQYIATDEIQARDADGLKLYDDGANGIFIKDGGNVGIGTTTPTNYLDVNGSVIIRKNLISTGITTQGNYLLEPSNTGIGWIAINGSFTNSNATAPDGTTTAGTFTLTTTSIDVYKSFTGLSSGDIYTVSTWVKLGTATNFCIAMDGIGGIASGSSEGLSTIKWKRVSYTFTVPSSGTVSLFIGAHGEAITQQTAGTVYLWNMEIVKDEEAYTNNMIIKGTLSIASTTLVTNLNADKVDGADLIDEDNMASNSVTKIPTQQSVKAYVDSQVASSNTLVELTDTNITSPSEASLLFYDTGTSKWIDNAVSGDVTIADTGVATLTAESVQDIAGGMVSGNTETLITVTYQDSDGTIDFVVDNNLSNYDNSSSGFITTNPLTSFTQNDAQYIATDEIRARDVGGLKLYDDGGNGLFVEDGGNVGIGTLAPTSGYKLDVSGDALINGLTVGKSDGNVENIALGVNVLTENSYNKTRNVVIGNNILTSDQGSLAHNNVLIGYDAIKFNGNAIYTVAIGNEALTLGRKAPNYCVAVGYKAGYFAGYLGTTNPYNVFIGAESGPQVHPVSPYTQETYKSVCIGYKAGYTLSKTATTTNNICIGYNSGNDAFLTLTSGNNWVVLGNNDTEKVVTKGSVGIGTSNPLLAKVHISSGDTPALNLGPNSAYSRSLILGGWNYGTAAEATIQTSNGNLHIDSKNGNSIYFNSYSSGGNINFEGSVIHSSDERWKTNWTPLEDSLEVIKKIKVGKFHFLDKNKNKPPNARWSYGVKAQDILKIIPDAVIINDSFGEKMGVDYSAIYAHLVKATQEQQSIIQSLKSEYESRINVLTERIESLEGNSSK